jgi:predicted nuclease with TOPRIM domain
MQTNKKIMFFLIPSLLILLPAGCSLPNKPVEVVFLPDSTQEQQNASVAKRFQNSALKGPTVVESAIELSEKYAKLSEQAAVLQQKNQAFIAENRRLKEQVAPLKAQSQQLQKELAEANDLLVEMRIELNNWKVDILGFRDEMRDADKAQLQALLKIFNILGGEVKAESAQDKETGHPNTALAEQTQTPEAHVTVTVGEQNE